MHCNVCTRLLGEPIFESHSHQALTSLCELRPGRVRVWACTTCGHLRSAALADNKAYYAADYRILLDHDDEDQIYDVLGSKIVYRTEHQLATLLGKVVLPEGAMLLDYGCAKGAMASRLLSQRPDLHVHLFDVSDMYRAHWDRFALPERCAVNDTPPAWNRHFDVITSFFALEHIPEPRTTAAHIASLLGDTGVFYGVVPDTFGNVADFVVIDHVNHFTAPSLRRLLSDAGFRDISIDSQSHRGALVFTARKIGLPALGSQPEQALSSSHALAGYWAALGERIRAAESANGGAVAAIYGSGFYGAYIASTLQHLGLISCFLDRSPFQQGKALFGKPIAAPEQLPADVRTLYIGLNPSIARDAVAAMAWLRDRDLRLVFLDGLAA